MKSNTMRWMAIAILLMSSIITIFCITPAVAVGAGVSVAPAEINITNAMITMNTAYQEGNWPRVAAYADLITNNDMNSGADIWRKWGYALMKMGDFEAALDVANAAVAHNPENHLCYLNRGYIHLALGNWMDARRDAESALEYAPANATAYNIIALGLLGQGDEKNALIAAETAVSLEPDNAEYLNTKGMILMSAGEYGKAVAVLSEAVEASGEGYNAPYPGAPPPEQNLNEARRLYSENSVPPYLIYAAAGLILAVAAGAGLIHRRIRK
jgi:tetratricopeptide (TPR) repeat protein